MQEKHVVAVRDRLAAEDDTHPPCRRLEVQDVLRAVRVEVEAAGRVFTEWAAAFGETHLPPVRSRHARLEPQYRSRLEANSRRSDASEPAR
ncbi:MAG: hypothetical protein AVDCRST_MAG38-701 [uncultured Solirubrobacteraceae bacterium]|uniref:Uncharacterized protein n=1 Tax=uncultured Solirubrobacteraceae bacterium TaxID=1162706 RepID=A0A6J4R746_9ACTN|nr:MAG: hypothetical protein AVDCRST_MAG38-701 [uncultured Solirubrobacteraceae bacterium]